MRTDKRIHNEKHVAYAASMVIIGILLTIYFVATVFHKSSPEGKSHNPTIISVGKTMLEAGEYGSIFYENIRAYSYDEKEGVIVITYINAKTEEINVLSLLPRMTTTFILKYRKWRGE